MSCPTLKVGSSCVYEFQHELNKITEPTQVVKQNSAVVVTVTVSGVVTTYLDNPDVCLDMSPSEKVMLTGVMEGTCANNTWHLCLGIDTTVDK